MRKPIMASASGTRTDGALGGHSGVEAVRQRARVALQSVGFWAAVGLPFATVGLLVAGLADQFPMLFGCLLVVNIVALVIGRNHHR